MGDGEIGSEALKLRFGFQGSVFIDNGLIFIVVPEKKGIKLIRAEEAVPRQDP